MSQEVKKTNKKKYYDNISVGKRTTQIVHFVQKHDKAAMFKQYLKNSTTKQTVVITKTKRSANELSYYLKEQNIDAIVIHGNHRKEQLQEANDAFNSSKTNILITTDMILKALELKNIQVMLNYELPTQAEDYFSRLRYVDEIGESISFVSPNEEDTLNIIEIMMKKSIEEKEVEGFNATTLNEVKKTTNNRTKKPRHKKQKTKKSSKQENV